MTKNRNIVLSGFFLALAMILPGAIGAVSPVVGEAISPLHIPALLCGFVCGKKYGAIVGFFIPILKVMIYGVPMLFIAIPMCFELAMYGLLTGLLIEKLGYSVKNTYISLLGAMLGGRIVYGICTYFITTFALLGSSGGTYTLAIFLASGAMFGGIIGAISHIVIVPSIVFALAKIKYLNLEVSVS